MKRNNLRRNINLIYLSQLCLGAVFSLPIILLYYQDKIGLTFQDFLIGEAVFAAVLLSFEVPTGWLSDKWSRKGTLIIGFIFWILGYVLLLLSNSFWDAMSAHAALGLAVALTSGTNSALVYDTLLELGEEDQFSRIEGKKFAFGIYGTAGASVIGGVMYSYNIHLPIIADIGTFLIGITAIACVIEPQRHKSLGQKHPIRDMLETIHFTLKGHVDVAGIVIVTAILFSATKVISRGQLAYFEYVGLDPIWFGIVIAFGALLGGACGQFGHIIEARYKDRHILMVLWGAIIATLLIAGYTTSLYAIPLLSMGLLGYGFGHPRVQSAINKRVSSERRAAILSTANMMVNMLFIPVIFTVGYISDSYHIGTTFIVLGLWVLISGSSAFFLWHKRVA
jgi:MFS family permease